MIDLSMQDARKIEAYFAKLNDSFTSDAMYEQFLGSIETSGFNMDAVDLMINKTALYMREDAASPTMQAVLKWLHQDHGSLFEEEGVTNFQNTWDAITHVAALVNLFRSNDKYKGATVRVDGLEVGYTVKSAELKASVHAHIYGED